MLGSVTVNKMKVLAAGCVLLVSASALAAEQDISIQGKPLQVVTADGKNHSLATCGDYLSLQKNKQQIASITGLSDRDYVEAQDSLIQCNIQNYVTQHQYAPITGSAVPSIQQVVAHLPASTALAVSDDEVTKLKAKGQGKTLQEWTPSLKLKEDRMVSDKDQVAYAVSQYQVFKNPQGQSLTFITLGSGVIGGTLGKLSTYRIDDMKGKVWTVIPVTENTPL
ncbi:hypothetical protein I6G64_22490 [Serratia plymuthica]|uniref:Uncharacterized protein n=2 Tax=Serratia plymuthica TaxID=82996 RepID=A0A7T2SRI8_SERPL|nr:hypothetical protein I6G64_22490 [Serratia plymuthica]QPS61902.1 hypothetical protein I6G52_17750 [Serratia plymuthica]